MASREVWCAEKAAQLLNEEIRILTLNEIKDELLGMSQDEVNETANILQLPIVFDCLNDSKSEQIDLACDVLSLCMQNLSLGESTNRYGSLLERALCHPSANVKIMALKEINRTALNPEYILNIIKETPLITAILVCVGDDDLSVAQKASCVTVLIGKTSQGLKRLMTPEIRQIIKQTLGISDIVRYRIYEILVDISAHSNESLQTLLPSGLIDNLLDELDNDDPLLKLNVVEFLAKLAFADHGMAFLESRGVIRKILGGMATLVNDPLGVLILPGFLKFYGNVTKWKPTEMFSEYPTAINNVFDIIINGDLTVLGVAFDTLGYISTTNAGKYELEATGPRLTATLTSIGKQLASLPTDLRIRGLYCIESLIRVPRDQQNNRVLSVVQNWFKSIHESSMMIIIQYAQNPFIEIRCAGLSILQALSEQLWGQQLINESAGLVEFLLNRKIESSKDSKEIKYEIVKALAESAVFNESVLEKLQQYVKEGPFYVHVVTEVAVEGST